MSRLPQMNLYQLALIVCFVLVVAINARPPYSADMGWHLRSGQWMVENGRVLDFEPFSFTFNGAPRVAYDWLGQVALYQVWALGGDAALSLLALALTAVTFALLTLAMPGHIFARLIALLFALALTWFFWTTRPQLFSLMFSAVVIWVMYRYKRGASPRLLLVLPPVFLLWGNLHGGWSIIAGAMVLMAVGEALNILTRTRAPHVLTWRRWALYVAAGVASAAVLMINPFGIDALLVPVVVLGQPSSIDFVTEWRPPDLQTPYGIALATLALLLVAGFITQIRARRLDWTQLLTTLAVGYLAFRYARSMPFFLIVATPVLIDMLTDWIMRTSWGRRSASLRPRPKQQALYYAVLGLTTLGAVVLVALILRPHTIRAYQAHRAPVDAIEVLLSERPPANIFPHYNWGGYLLWRAQDYPIFIDGRVDIYTDFVFEWDAIRNGENWEAEFERWDINTVLLMPRDPLTGILREHEGWRILHEDEIAVLLTRAG